MTCREFADFMMDYLSGDLPPDVRSQFDHHLRACRNCGRYLDSYRAAVALGRQAFADQGDAPTDAPEELIQAILAARRRDGSA